MPGKLEDAGHVGDDSAGKKTPVKRCCAACGFDGEGVRRCSHCKSTHYCSIGCQLSHRSHHKVYCAAIASLEEVEKEKLYRWFSLRQCQVDFRTKKKLMRLVGEKPVVKCKLGDKEADVLWDTGSMVSLVDRKWLAKNFPDAEIISVSEFLEEKLELRAANSTSIALDGVVVLDFSLVEGSESVRVPFVVTSQNLLEPILGYNVIEHLLLEGKMDQRTEFGRSLSCPDGKVVSVDALAAVMEEKAGNRDFLAEVKSPKTVSIPAGCHVRVKCRVKAQSDEREQTVYFSPLLSPDGSEDRLVSNEAVSKLRRGHTNHVIVDVMNLSSKTKVLNKGAVLGSMHSVSSVMPMTRMFNAGDEKADSTDDGIKTVDVGCVEVEEGGKEENEEKQKQKWNLSHLEKEKRDKLHEMLTKYDGIFSKDASDIGDIQDFQMRINVMDDVPVSAAYRKKEGKACEKRDISTSKGRTWIRTKLSFCLLRSTHLCIRGSRTKRQYTHETMAETNIQSALIDARL